jgi:hypothetical protein
MNVDKALANFTSYTNVRSGDTGRRRVEHRSILQSVHSPKCEIQVKTFTLPLLR